MGAVTNRLTLALAEAKAYLRVEVDDEDALITELIAAAKSSADAFLNNPFVRDGTPLPIPVEVKTWVLRRVAFLYEQRVENLVSDTLASVGAIDYGARLQQAPLDHSLIRPYRLNPGL